MSLESLGIFSGINPEGWKMKIYKIPISSGIIFFPFYFNSDNFLGSLNKTFFKPKIYKQTPKKLKIKST